MAVSWRITKRQQLLVDRIRHRGISAEVDIDEEIIRLSYSHEHREALQCSGQCMLKISITMKC